MKINIVEMSKRSEQGIEIIGWIEYPKRESVSPPDDISVKATIEQREKRLSGYRALLENADKHLKVTETEFTLLHLGEATITQSMEREDKRESDQ